MHLPADEPLPGTNESLLYTVVADEAFPLKTWMMRPYPGRVLDCLQKRVFNYRLSRARRTIENTFGLYLHAHFLYGVLNQTLFNILFN